MHDHHFDNRPTWMDRVNDKLLFGAAISVTALIAAKLIHTVAPETMAFNIVGAGALGAAAVTSAGGLITGVSEIAAPGVTLAKKMINTAL